MVAQPIVGKVVVLKVVVISQVFRIVIVTTGTSEQSDTFNHGARGHATLPCEYTCVIRAARSTTPST